MCIRDRVSTQSTWAFEERLNAKVEIALIPNLPNVHHIKFFEVEGACREYYFQNLASNAFFQLSNPLLVCNQLQIVELSLLSKLMNRLNTISSVCQNRPHQLYQGLCHIHVPIN
eukprot:TRINITY_DN16257_c0_g1_i1.p1 TRINITY_DN16257_c0_g1~~TRINITY_DN16257_c0_g1_i1.p1  ORF type:complete len:134 (+),score=2.27 TRINITY_DN16257_c0_g1_i1:63-404(+)